MPFRNVQPIGPLAGWRGWRCACALGIGFSYCLTYLLISWCLATGVFHPSTDAPHASHHHAGAHAHDQHHGPASDTSWADICDLALQALLASVWTPTPESVAVGSPGEAIRGLDDEEIWPPVAADLSIRSPPLCTTA
jgi:hypothetical protein